MTVRRRPRDRKAQLASAAAELFRGRGYHAVGVGDIAAAAGITGPAVYRHFENKQAILGHVLLTGVDELADLLTPLSVGGDPRRLLLAAADASVAHRDITALWRWQGRHLGDVDKKEIRRRTGELMVRWQVGLRGLRPELDAADATLLCFAALSVFGSVGDHRATPARLPSLLADLADAVIRSDVVPATGPAPAPWRGRSTAPGTRREELLSAATRLFRQHGFHAVSMEDIGAATGIAGPSVYRHFAGKSDILLAAGRRMADRLSVGLENSLASATDAHDAIRRLARSYVETVLRSDDLIAVYTNEVVNLPEREARELRALQRGYVVEWVRLVREVAPRLNEAEARVVVHAALTIINDLPRTPRLASRPGLADELTGLAVAVVERA